VPSPAERLITASIVAIVTVVSLVLMLSWTSPELSWDEASYTANTHASWGRLWSTVDYDRHFHGPMAIYLVKLSEEVLPGQAGSVESRLRFLIVLAGSLGIGLLYWALRHIFGTSRPAALVGCGLLLLSVIRIKEANIIGPHHLMLACTLAVVSLGYHSRNRPSLRSALVLGTVLGFGALSMTYVIPVFLCWTVAVALAGAGWVAWDRTHLKISWLVPAMVLTAAVVVLVVWPPGVLRYVVLKDFDYYVHYRQINLRLATLVGDRLFETPPFWAAGYWLASLEAPLLITAVATIAITIWKARKGGVTSKHIYLSVSVAFLLMTALVAHQAGARNLLQFVGVLCLATGAVFDEALGHNPRIIRFSSAAILIMAALNLAWLSQYSRYKPYFATDGYRALVEQQKGRLSESAKVMVYGLPVLKFYAEQAGTALAWDASEMPWTTHADIRLAPDIKYVLIPAFVYHGVPAEQPLRAVVAAHWKTVWSFNDGHAWELRLFEKP